MTRILTFLGWTALTAYLVVLIVANVVVVVDLYRPPEGPWPGWMPLLTADIVYGGLGIVMAMATRWMWRRHARQHPIHVHGEFS